jgi:hypothetical protein
MAITWITPAGSLGTITERITQNIPIQASSPDGPVTFTLLSGKLPRGLRVDTNITVDENITSGYIKGSPTEVRKFSESRFVIRASDGVDIEDRTFSIAVDGADDPRWVTKEGFLNIGKGKAFYVLDNSYVNFQLEAYDPDLSAGDVLEYYLMPMGGQLPPGLTLSKDGVISGFTDPIFALEYQSNATGAFDTGSYDTDPLDFGRNNTVGFDSFLYDLLNFDYSEVSVVPRRLSRIYTFAVGVTDGFKIITRIFKIYVVTEEFLKSDNTLVQVDTNIFTADSDSTRSPIWITESNLGRFRANNFVTIFLDVYDPPSLEGTIAYFLLPTNPDGSASIIPQGLELDTTTGELAGRVPYQDRVTKQYKFTMLAVNFPTILPDADYNLVGDWDPTVTYQVNQSVRYNGFIYLCTQINSNRPPATNDRYWFLGVTSTEKTFVVEVIGEIESGIRWITNADLGEIKPNKPSSIAVEAESQLYGGRVVYEMVSGKMPPGLAFLSNGFVVGKVQQFADSSNIGLTRFYDRLLVIKDRVGIISEGDTITGETSGATARVILSDLGNNELYYKPLYGTFVTDEVITNNLATATVANITEKYSSSFDQGDTTIDKVYTFTVRARDTANAAEDFRTFFITVISETDKTFANLYVKALQDRNKRLEWFDFISDVSIFDPRNLYRYGDTNFGIQSELKMLMYAGIESTEASKYVQAMSRNHYRKRLLFGDLKMAKAKDPSTQETIYEVIYVDIVDEYEKNGKSISNTIQLSNNINSKVLVSYNAIKVDSDVPLVSDSDHQRIFPNSVKNMRNRIRTVGDRDREFLPLWMRSIQDRADYELGYTKALVLCYALPGKSAEIMARIKASGFDFKKINFVADRYVIDIIDGEIQDKYLAFPQRGEKLP